VKSFILLNDTLHSYRKSKKAMPTTLAHRLLKTKCSYS